MTQYSKYPLNYWLSPCSLVLEDAGQIYRAHPECPFVFFFYYKHVSRIKKKFCLYSTLVMDLNFSHRLQIAIMMMMSLLHLYGVTLCVPTTLVFEWSSECLVLHYGLKKIATCLLKCSSSPIKHCCKSEYRNYDLDSPG